VAPLVSTAMNIRFHNLASASQSYSDIYVIYILLKT
jgi:hypothetical protein